MDKSTATNLIESTFNQAFDETRFELFAKNFLNDVEPKSNSYSGQYIWDDYKEHVNTYKRIGKYIDPDGEALDILIVEVKSVLKLERARTALRNFVIKHLVKFEKDYALVAFYSKQDEGADWRFSFIKLEHQAFVDEEKGKVKTRKEFTPAKRYSFLVGKYEKAYTAKNQLLPLLQNVSSNATIEEIESAFSIEKVTDEFFSQYKDLFVKLYEHFENDATIQNELVKSKIDTSRFTKKLLGQIVFLYFLQKKGWLGVPKDKTWGNGEKHFIQKLFETSKNENKNFFKDYLQFLFYEALAKERDNENSYYAKFNCRIPFLNGGLFEAEYDWKNANISIPETIFRNEEKNKSGDIGTGILDVFDRYNFTIKEDEPLDKEVAVDPEMLGKVFENMLEVTERKSKGAFYTPREIVHYMCQESLIHYLDNSLNNYTETFQEIGDSQTNMFGNAGKKGQHSINLSHQDIKVPKTDIEHFIRNGHFALEHDQRVVNKGKETAEYKYILPESIRQHADLIDKKLTEIKICDPAIGSGAFPVGLLHELVNAHLVIKPHLSPKYLAEKLKAIKGEHNGNELSESRYIYRLKRHIIQESIYGVDIDASAIDIARLRLWLSLVVDEDDFEPIETLPNLDYKIVCGNSLIGLPASAMRSLEVEKELEGLKQQFYNETNEQEKKQLRSKINNKIRELLDSAEQFAGYKIDFDFKLFFSEVWHEKGGFDVVIGNPPFVFTRDVDFGEEFKSIISRNFFSLLSQGKKTKANQAGKINLFALFIIQGLILTKRQGVLNFIVPNNILRTTTYDSIRKYILDNYTIDYIADLGAGIFSNVTASTVLFSVANKKSNELSRLITDIESLEYTKYKEKTVNQESFKKNVSFAFNIHVENNSQFILDDINKNACLFGNYCIDIIEGIVAHKELIFDEPMEGTFPLIEGKTIKRYYLQTIRKHIKWDLNKIHRKRPDYLWNESKKIVMQRISGGLMPLVATLDIEKNKAFASVNNIVLKDQYKDLYYYFVALLNSEIINWYYSICYSNKSNLTVNISKTYLESLPIKGIKDGFKLETLVRYLLFIKNDFTASKIEVIYIEQLINGIIYEFYFHEKFLNVKKQIINHLGDLKPITDSMSDEEKLAVIQSEFERLYDPNHPVRNNLETLDSIEEVRIIKEALK